LWRIRLRRKSDGSPPPPFRIEAASKRRLFWRGLDHLVRLVIGLAVAAEDRRLCIGIEVLDIGCDLGVLALEQRVADEVALGEEWPCGLGDLQQLGCRMGGATRPRLTCPANQCGLPRIFS
jgi:hypothetical protein